MPAILMPELKEATAKLTAKSAELKTMFSEAWTDNGELDMKLVSGDGSPEDKVSRMRELNAEIDDLEVKCEGLRPTEAAAQKALELNRRGEAAAGGAVSGDGADPGDGSPTTKSLGHRFVESDAFANKGVKSDLDGYELKALFERSAGWQPESTRSGQVVLSAQRPIQVTDLIPQIPTSQAAYKYMLETTFTNAAAERAEGGAYAEAALALTEQSATIESIGVFLPMTDEQLEDEAGAAAYVDLRLPFMVSQRLDGQVLVGDGLTPNVEGLNNVSGIQTQALGVDSVPDATYKALVKCRTTGQAMPNALIFNPSDWQTVRLLTTTDGIYLWGPPSDAGPARMWGVPVVEAQAQTLGTAIAGDFSNFSLLVIRRGLDVRVSDSHSDYFAKGKQAVRAGIRVATVWTRPAAFCTVTGI